MTGERACLPVRVHAPSILRRQAGLTCTTYIAATCRRLDAELSSCSFSSAAGTDKTASTGAAKTPHLRCREAPARRLSQGPVLLFCFLSPVAKCCMHVVRTDLCEKTVESEKHRYATHEVLHLSRTVPTDAGVFLFFRND